MLDKSKVLEVIKNKPGITSYELRNEVFKDIPRRTLYAALTNLVQTNQVVKRQALLEARQYKYFPSSPLQ